MSLFLAASPVSCKLSKLICLDMNVEKEPISYGMKLDFTRNGRNEILHLYSSENEVEDSQLLGEVISALQHL